ncbi:dihydrodipicolinate synthase family protein [Niabella sp. CC-SYL272]|uniref:dihydrodipicolinate synthase family protein n=1 Tax=Niabella agricola TaxID=2891571 RepID=UPI001F1F11A6|nr:dihydrodipicolinate synthase family protein [Niabella agricola]MCF3108852.1 dihydrodipicolinate synthase family protein [Niabella agricola]
MKVVKGFIPVMLTPFNENGSIDFDGLTRLTNWYLKNGAKGLFANCQSSEMFALLPEERLQIIAHVIKTVAGKVPVVATGNFGSTLSEQAAFIKAVHALGTDAVILLTNQLVKQQEPEPVLEAAIMKLLALTGQIPVGFYECPVPYKIILSPELLGRLVKTGRVIYHKDTCLDIAQVRAKNRLCSGNEVFGLYDAYMGHAVASLQSGSAGLSCIQGNYFPELVAWLCEHYNQPGLRKEVQLVQQFFMDEMELMHKDYPKAAKYYLWKKGMNISIYTRESGNSEIAYDIKNGIEGLEWRYQRLAEQIAAVFAGK